MIRIESLHSVENAGIPGTEGRNELDTHAHAAALGPNWRVIELTGEVVDVHGFKADIGVMKDIPIVKAASVYVCRKTGRQYLLVIDQAMYFGTLMDHSLINPNQVRQFGHSLCDDPYDPHRGLQLETDDLVVPFEIDGPDIYFESRAPTDDELEELEQDQVLLTGPAWNPNEKNLLSELKQLDRGNVALEAIRAVQDICGCAGVTEEDKSMRQMLNGTYSGSMAWQLSQVSTAFDEGAAIAMLTQAVNYTEKDIEPREADLEVPGIDFNSFKDYKGMAIAQVRAQINRESRQIGAVRPTSRHASITTEHLAKTFLISKPKAQELQRITTQKGVRRGVGPMERRLRDLGPSLNRPRLGGHWYGDIVYSSIKSLDQNTCAFLFANEEGYKKVYPMETKSNKDCAFSYHEFRNDVGIPAHLTTDLEPAMVGRKTDFKRQVQADGVNYTMSERGRKNQNWAAELSIGMLRRRWRKFKHDRSIPDRLWDFGWVYLAELDNFLPAPNGRSRFENVHGYTPDIGEYCDFSLYDLCNVYHEEEQCLGRWLGVSHRIGNRLTYWVLRDTGRVIATSNVTHLTIEEWQDPDKQAAITRFNDAIDAALSPHNHDSRIREQGRMIDDLDTGYALDRAYGDNTPTDADYQTPEALPHVDDIIDGDNDLDHDSPFDQLIGVEISIDDGDGNLRRGKVKRRKTDDYGKPTGKYNKNIMLNHAEFIVEMVDGSEETMLANQIAENMFSQTDSEGNQFLLMDEIIDHKKDKSAIPIEDGFVVTKSGNKVAKKTTRGWKLLAKFKDGGMEWLELKDLKESYPVELAEYAVANGLTHEPAFNWWVRKVLNKRDRIIAKVKSRYWKTNTKYGIRLPKSVEEALQIDRETQTDYWGKAIKKEMDKAKVAWIVHHDHTPEEVRKGQAPGLIGYQEIRCHMVFDIKMDLTRKARFVANGNETTAPSHHIYSSVVSRDSVRLAFLIAGLNGLDLKAADITNAYLNAPTKEKIWFKGGLETGEGCGKVCVLTRALYGLRGSGNAWRSFFAKALEAMGFKSTQADRDVWIRPAVDREKKEYYEMICVYVDDLLVVSHDPDAVLEVVQQSFELKGGKGEVPTTYLGATISKVDFQDGSSYWAMSPEQYLKNAVKVVEDMLAKDGQRLKGRSVKTPLPADYRPELDNSEELGPELASRYLQLIGIARWAIELGALDFYLEVALMSHHQALPRKGHLEALYHMFAYIKNMVYPKGNTTWRRRLVLDGADPEIELDFIETDKDWHEFYPDAMEEIPVDRPKPRGKPVKINCFVDANHAGNVVTRRSHTGILIFVQNAPIIWFSKRQNTVETSTFGSEFIALRTAKELIVALRYKLRMFGVPIVGPYGDADGPAVVHCDNAGVVANTTEPTSTLTKKHNSINYHTCREAVAAGIMVVSKEDTEYNLADLFTKMLGASKRLAFRKLLY